MIFGLSRRSLVLLSLPFAVLLAAAVVLFYLPPGNAADPQQEFIIQEGDGLSKIARLLAREDLIRSRYLFWLYVVASGTERDLKAGRYLLSRGTSMVDIAKILVEGKAEHDDIVVIVPEGFNVWEIDRRLAERGLTKVGDFFKKAQPLDGQLFPDTYRLKKNQESGIMNQGEELIKELLGKMRENFKVKAGNISQEQLIVASMLEKEVQKQEDMALVAGIIYKRLELKMLLQIDASVAYGVCLEESRVAVFKNCDVSQVNLIKSIKIDGLYNTYTRSGLPWGSISNPGSQAIDASLHPQTSDYLYYLSARDGRTIFSKTATEHERNRAKYLLR